MKPKMELIKKAVELAKEKHPEGFNHKQLVEVSKEVYGGFGEVVASGGLLHKKVATMRDVTDMGNAMAQIDGHYPVGMSGCYVVGLNGDCGLDCPVYLDGECGEPNEFNTFTPEEKKVHIELYGEVVR